MKDNRTEQERKDAENLYYESERRMRQNRDSAMIVFYALVIASVLGVAYGIIKIF